MWILTSIMAWCHDSFFKLTDKFDLKFNLKSNKLYMGIEDPPRTKLKFIEPNKKGTPEDLVLYKKTKDSDSSSSSGSSSGGSSKSFERLNNSLYEWFRSRLELTVHWLDLSISHKVVFESKNSPKTPNALSDSYWYRYPFNSDEFNNSTEGKVLDRKLTRLDGVQNYYHEDCDRNFDVVFNNIEVYRADISSPSQNLSRIDLKIEGFNNEREKKVSEFDKWINEEKDNLGPNKGYWRLKYQIYLSRWVLHKKSLLLYEYLEALDKELKEKNTPRNYRDKYSRGITDMKDSLFLNTKKFGARNSLILEEVEKLKISR